MKKLRVLDLFSGIGGFSLGLERTGGFETVAFCEIEEFPRRVLAKHWPEVPCYHDVRELSADALCRDGIAVDVICGGFPCQDISSAGKMAGIEGQRSGLWGQIVRLCGELQPSYVIVENVSNLLAGGNGSWFARVLSDLASIGYDATWHCIPASHIGALHQRDRVWVIAYPNADSVRLQGFRRPKGRPWSEEQFAGLVQVVLQTSIPTRNGGGIHDWVSNRAHRLRALGNSIVPQIPEMIGYAILDMERAAA